MKKVSHMGVETTDYQLLEKCLEFLTPSIVLDYIEQHTPVDCVKLACGFGPLASVAPAVVQDILDKMDYVFQEGGQSLSADQKILSHFKELTQINKPIVVIFLGLGPMRFQDTPLGEKLYTALDGRLIKSIDPVNALCAELITKHCPEIIRPFFRENRQPKISFVILSGLNNGKVLDEMLASFSAKTPPKPDIEVIVVVNGSTDETAEISHRHLEAGYDYRVVRLPENLGVAGGYNEGIALARGKYICLLQDDVLFKQEDWHRELAHYLDIYPEIGVMGGQRACFMFRPPEPYHLFEPPHRHVCGDNWPSLNKFLVKVDTAQCMAVMFRKELGFYDERFLPNGLEDIAFSFKARKEGWSVYATQVGVKHELGGERSATHHKNDSFTNKIRCLQKKLLDNKITHLLKKLLDNKIGCLLKRFLRMTDDLNSDSKEAIGSRLSRAYHYQLFMQEYGDMLRELPAGRESITLDDIEENIETLPKNWQRRSE